MRQVGYCPYCKCHQCNAQSIELKMVTLKLLMKKMGITKEMLKTGTVEHWKGKLE